MVDYTVLRSLGFSKTAVACYQSLDQDGATGATELAERLSKPRTGLYRILKHLEQQDFVISVKTDEQPAYFYARPLDKALQLHADYQRRQLAPLIEMQRQRQIIPRPWLMTEVKDGVRDGASD